MEKEKINKVFFKNLISENDIKKFEELHIYERERLINFVCYSFSLKNARKYLSKNKQRRGGLYNRLQKFFLKCSMVTFVGCLLTLLLLMFNQIINQELISVLINIRNVLGIMTIGFIFACAGLAQMTEQFLVAKEDLLKTYKYNKTTISTLDFIMEIFKTNNEKDNLYIKSIIMQETYKLYMKFEPSGDISNLDQYLHMQVRNIIMNGLLKEKNKEQDFFWNLVENIDKRLDKLK